MREINKFYLSRPKLNQRNSNCLIVGKCNFKSNFIATGIYMNETFINLQKIMYHKNDIRHKTDDTFLFELYDQNEHRKS